MNHVAHIYFIGRGWGGGIRTHAWRSQSPLPYRLATPHYMGYLCNRVIIKKWGGISDSNRWPPVPQTGALTNWTNPTIIWRAWRDSLLDAKQFTELFLDKSFCLLCSQTFVSRFSPSQAVITFGALGGTRTFDLPLRRRLLYPAELQTRIWSGWRESNPRVQLGRLTFYHWTTPAFNS